MHDIEHLPGIFTLGYLGETNFRTIEIDMNAWLDEIPNGVASVIHIRPGESADQAYMAATTFEDGILKWPITALDLGNYDGYGTMQISLHGMDADNHQIGKSENVRTRVNDSATSMSGDIPDAQQAWMDRMTELIDEQRIQKDKIDNLVDGIDRFPVVTYVKCGSWYNMLAMWTLASSGQVIPGVTTHDGESYGLHLTKPDEYEPRDNDLLMIRMTADLKTPYQLTKYYISFVYNESVYDPETGKTYYTDATQSYPIDNMNLYYDSDITLFEKDRVYVFRYHTKQVNGRTQHVYDVLNYTPGLKEAAELAETALTEAQAIIDGNVVRYDRPQSLTYEQKTQFRDNIGAAELLGGKIPASQLPSYVDDVLEYSSLSTFPATGESGKIYVALDANLTYRWTGSTYIEISQSLALGETDQTAFPGDRGLAVETEVETRAKILYAECTEIVTNPAGFRRICVNVPNGYSPKSGDYLAVKFPVTNEIANPPHRYALHYNFHGAVITEDVTVMNLAQDKFDAGTVVFEADSIYLFRHIDEDECQIVGHRVGQALGDTAGTAFPGERGKAVEDAIDGLDERFDEKANATDVEALIKVQDAQPTEPANKVWIKETPDEEVQVPTVAEMETGLAGKINKPAIDGTAGQILRTDGAGGTSWENPATAEEIAAATDTWLQENITNPSNPPLDRSLSLENAAAPADMVGDLKSTSSVWDSLANDGMHTFSADELEQGQWGYSTKMANAARIRFKSLIPVRAGMSVIYSSQTQDMYFGVLATPTANAYITGLSGWKSAPVTNGVFNITQDGWMTFIIRDHADNTKAITPADYDCNVMLFSALKNTTLSRYAGKRISIIGDSIETFNKAGYKIDGYIMYYPNHGVVDVDQTWWMQVIHNSGARLEVNASYSGTRVTDTHPEDRPDFYARTSLLGDPDLIFVALGSNDTGVALGDYDYVTQYTELTESEFRPAYIKGIKGLQALYPNAEIICVTEIMSQKYKDSIFNIAKTLGVTFIDVSGYATVASGNIHPGILGMRQIASKILYPTDKTISQANIPADAAEVRNLLNKEIGSVQKEIDRDVRSYGIDADMDLEWLDGTTTTYQYGPNAKTEPNLLRTSNKLIEIPKTGLYIYYSDTANESEKAEYRVDFFIQDGSTFVKAEQYEYLVEEITFTIPTYIHYSEGVYIGITYYKSEYDGTLKVASGEPNARYNKIPFLFPVYTKVAQDESSFNLDIGSVNPYYYYSYARSYGTILPLRKAKRIITSPKYNLSAQIYKVDGNEQEVTVVDSIFSKCNYGDAEFVEGVPAIDLSKYDFDGFAIICIGRSYYYKGISRMNDGMGQLASYDDVMNKTSVIWENYVTVEYDGNIPAKAKANIETIKQMTIPQTRVFDYGSWISSASHKVPAMRNSNFYFYNGSDHCNVPLMHVTYESIVNASLNPNGRIYKEKLTSSGTSYNYGYGSVCSTMAGLITGTNGGIQTAAMYLEMLNDYGFETRDIQTIEDVRTGDFLLRLDQSTNFEYGHVLYVTDIIRVDGVIYAVIGLEAYPPFIRYLAFVNYDAFPFNTSTGLFNFYSSREIGGNRYNKAARLEYSKYKTIREAYGYIEKDFAINESGIMCDRGSGSVYCIGQSCQISISSSITDALSVYRGNTFIGTITPATISEVENGYKIIDISSMLTAAGSYTIRRGNIDVEHFIVASAQTVSCVSIPDDPDHIKIIFSQNDAVAVAVEGYYFAGAPINHTYQSNMETTAEDQESGYMIIPKYGGINRYPIDYFDVLYRTNNGTFRVLCYSWTDSVIDNENVTIKQSSQTVGVTAP